MKAFLCKEFGPVDSHKVEEIEVKRFNHFEILKPFGFPLFSPLEPVSRHFDLKFEFYASRSPYNRILRSEIRRLGPDTSKMFFKYVFFFNPIMGLVVVVVVRKTD